MVTNRHAGEEFSALEDLDRWELEHEHQDIRGRMLVSLSNEPIGRIDQLLVDRDEERVAAVRLEDGRKFPVEPLTIRDDVVVLTTPTEKKQPKDELVVGKPLVEQGPIRVRSRAAPMPAPEPSSQAPRPQAPKAPQVPEPPQAPKAVRPQPLPPQPRPLVRKPVEVREKPVWDWGRIGMGAGAVAVAAGAALLIRRKSEDSDLPIETDENFRLISSTKVEGTPVVGRDGKRLGEIENLMVDKYSGRVAYAVIKLGGTMGFGASLFPIPWPLLEYDVSQDGYVLDITKKQLANAPKFQPNEEPEFDPEYRRHVARSYSA